MKSLNEKKYIFLQAQLKPKDYIVSDTKSDFLTNAPKCGNIKENQT